MASRRGDTSEGFEYSVSSLLPSCTIEPHYHGTDGSRYDPSLPNVLHELNFAIAAGEKIGIVGSTGSGKSTIALSFFRFVEAWNGSIVIDGIDIASIGLTDLRRRLTIIPQGSFSLPVTLWLGSTHGLVSLSSVLLDILALIDPTILSGTLRSALDIFTEYTDSDIFDALRRVHLIKPEDEDDTTQIEDGANRSPFLDLNGEVSEGGTNFSQGEFFSCLDQKYS